MPAHGPHPQPRRVGPPRPGPGLRPRCPPAARGGVRAVRRPAAGGDGPGAPGGRDPGGPPRRLDPARARRPGLDRARAGPRPGAVRPGHRRAVVVRARAATTPSSTATRTSAGATSTRACAASGAARTRSPRTARVRTRGRWSSTAVRDARDRRVRPERREVVRHRAGRHRLHDLPLPPRRRRAPPAHPVPRRLRHARGPAGARPGLHPHLRRPSPAVRPRPTCGSPRARSSARSGRPTS